MCVCVCVCIKLEQSLIIYCVNDSYICVVYHLLNLTVCIIKSNGDTQDCTEWRLLRFMGSGHAN